MKMNLKNKITFNICIIVILSLVVMCTSLYAMSASILSEDSNTFTEVQILRAQEKIELQVDKIRLETLAMSKDQRVRDFFKGKLGTEELNRYLTEEMETMNREAESYYYKDLFCLDLDGVITSSTMPNAMYVDLSSRKYVQESFKRSTTATSDILIALTDQASIVNTTHPVFDENGEMLGLFGIAIRAEKFVGFIKNFAIGENGYFSIVDSNGLVLSHRDPALIGHPAAEVLPFFSEMNGEEPGEIYKHVDHDYVCSYKKMDQNDWVLYTVMPRRELAAKSLQLLKSVIIFGTIISGCAIFASIYFSNKISSPIDSITEYINSAESGNDFLGNSISETIENVKTNAFDKEAHALIQKSRTLTASLEMKSYLTARFLSALSHDIRTSLTLIKGYSKGILSGLVEDEETKERFIQEIYRSADTLERISYDVLDSTYEAQNSEQINKEIVYAEEFCESLYQTAQAYVENSDRLFEGSLEKVGGKLFISDVKIIRVWQNMLSNAVKYSAPYSTVSIRITLENGQFLFQITDQGMGISAEEREYIFDMFYKGDPSQKESYGLGLYVSKRILEAHGSKLCFESEPGKGSTFWFKLPAMTDTKDDASEAEA